MKFLITSVALLAGVASALPTSSAETDASLALRHLENRATTCTKAATDNLIFKASIGSFEKSRKAKNPSKCNWSSDNCSKSPDKPDGYNFIPSCQRHDFGYRNTKAQKRFTKAMKKRIDDNFKKDLYKYCSQFHGLSSWKGVECRRLADIYYAAVRKLGKREEEAVDNVPDNVADLELDPDIEGQVIPEVLEDDGEDYDDPEKPFAE
ncbi:prokaryotic phospholipase A2-domain-containing protein [Ilyonectria robusta]|uniref:prokaryotic phospholipase A2-domain-containing protein n=1 Tax=Ilyonectria robusta TaxID=1079257 RepID=UPI001E8D23CE|nr:prokaryotic phospholipase A2-domain-containing protein [Ilyonectria robusta]KAH8661033.1 prokaryotic phospholipase A2-domain-containing protein [Ilyonectria robusta]